jgi:anthranilate/para-aminobenzoate synthase component I
VPRLSAIRLDRVPDRRLVTSSPAVGATLLQGWRDGATILLPWPEEARELAWPEAGRWKEFLREIESDPLLAIPGDTLPFFGGWAGFIAYEAAATEEAIAPRTIFPPEPAAFFARHLAGVVVRDGKASLFAPEGSERHYLALLEKEAGHAAPPPYAAATLRDSLGGGEHRRRVELIREMIRDGSVYQVNLTREWSADAVVDPGSLYEVLTAPSPPRSSAFIRGNGWTIVSASPEVLLDFDRAKGIAESLPIKGTVRREGNDEREIAELLASTKDESEHLMIVDVVRNDLGRIAPVGSVTVAEYRAVRTLEHVHHLESTVRAEGLGTTSVADILAALSPAASITGAPKRAAVAAIRELEPGPRGVYCGSIGWIDARGARFSVAIRTAVVTPSSVRYHAGGGIVWDSDAASEDDESRAKAEAFLRHLGGEV